MTKSRLMTGRNVSIALSMTLLLAPTAGPGQTTAHDPATGSLANESANARETRDAPGSSMHDALAALIVSGVKRLRDEALAAPNDALPPEVREAFRDHVPERLLRKVRWRVDNDAMSLERAVFALRDTPALTVDYVILFADAEDTSRLLLWAHELHHVMQFDAWGIEGFVARYLADYESIEHEANEFVWRWRDATR